ncbi:hypothetical protein [Nocardiopsis sp. CNT312]|nr:hypothetical protein [Nocardiopsis sp. CNT312]
MRIRALLLTVAAAFAFGSLAVAPAAADTACELGTVCPNSGNWPK